LGTARPVLGEKNYKRRKKTAASGKERKEKTENAWGRGGSPFEDEDQSGALAERGKRTLRKRSRK